MLKYSENDVSQFQDMVAIDCEMVVTEMGSELARITVVGENGDTLYDKLVKPANAVVDYCTPWR